MEKKINKKVHGKCESGNLAHRWPGYSRTWYDRFARLFEGGVTCIPIEMASPHGGACFMVVILT